MRRLIIILLLLPLVGLAQVKPNTHRLDQFTYKINVTRPGAGLEFLRDGSMSLYIDGYSDTRVRWANWGDWDETINHWNSIEFGFNSFVFGNGHKGLYVGANWNYIKCYGTVGKPYLIIDPLTQEMYNEYAYFNWSVQQYGGGVHVGYRQNLSARVAVDAKVSGISRPHRTRFATASPVWNPSGRMVEESFTESVQGWLANSQAFPMIIDLEVSVVINFDVNKPIWTME